jgi:opacity protein-like surface antigen
VKFLPFGTAGGFQPYVGAGISAVNFHYTETGDFVDPSTLEIFNDKFTADGFAFGTLIFGGARIPIGGDVYALQVEGRYLFGNGDTGGADAGFLGDKIDLSGGSLNFGFLIRF